MKNITVYIVLIILLISCVGVKDNLDIEVVPIDAGKVSEVAKSFIDKIEFIPLETNEKSLIKDYRKMMYSKEMDMYAILDKRFIVFLFSGDGKFIGSSEAQKGEGPKQYQLITDMKFNPYLKAIDLLNPYGTIYSFDKTFELIDKKKIDQTEIVFTSFMALNENEYVFTPSLLMDDEAVYRIDFKKNALGKMAQYTGTLSTINMDRDAFYKNGDKYYFVPTGINYNFYRIDTLSSQLVPVIKLDFGGESILESSLPGMAKVENGKINEQTRILAEQIGVRNRYLEESDYVLPLIKFFNDNYVYVHFIKNREPSNFIYNRNTKQSFLQKGKKPLHMPFSFAIEDNILFSIVDPYNMGKYIDSSLMSEEDIRKLSLLKEDDNPVILKYYLN